MTPIIVYGAYGYTGKLVVEEALAKNMQITLAGRSEEKLMALSSESGYPYRAVDLNDQDSLHALLQHASVVIHCAGPFQHTARAMVEACLATGTNYLDITGEYPVFEMLQKYDQQAKAKGIMLLPGAGFDVVPSDCLAATLKSKLPDAHHLQLAFATQGGGLSRGTSKTMIEGAGYGQVYRKDGQLTSKPQGHSTMVINYGKFEKLSVGISWGDISTAYVSTGIPNIEVFTGSTEKQINMLKWIHRLRIFMRMNWVKNLLKQKVDKQPAGPSEEKRNNSKTYLWGEVRNLEGTTVTQRLITPNGYTLTVKTSLLFASKILGNNLKPGFQTPSTAYGKDVILEIEDCHFLDT